MRARTIQPWGTLRLKDGDSAPELSFGSTAPIPGPRMKVDTGNIVTAVSFPVKDPAVLSGVDDIRWPGAVFSLQTRTNQTGVPAGR